MKAAIHPVTLEVREFQPGNQLEAKGYVLVGSAEDLLTLDGTIVSKLGTQLMPRRRVPIKNRGVYVTLLWAEVVMASLRRHEELQAIKRGEIPEAPPLLYVEKEGEKFGVKGAYQKRDGFTLPPPGRGNHKPRQPSAFINQTMEIKDIPQMSPQPTILAIECLKAKAEFNPLTPYDVEKLLKRIKMNTKQDPVRIWRYYFWHLVKAGVLIPIHPKTGETPEDADAVAGTLIRSRVGA